MILAAMNLGKRAAIELPQWIIVRESGKKEYVGKPSLIISRSNI
jgi:hypothetical protein